MKKILTYICIAAVTMTTVFSSVSMAAEEAEQKISVYLNGEEIDFSQEPVVIDRRTMIPLRGIFEKMGYSISWDASTKSCLISNDIQKITMRDGHKGMQVNDQAFMLDVPAQIINDSFMIPLRAVAECTGAVVTWDANTKTVYINSNHEERVTFTTNEFAEEYMEAISELDGVNSLFKTLNSLTERNYTNRKDVLERQITEAELSLDSVYDKLAQLDPPDAYAEFYELSFDIMDTVRELCSLVEDMLNEDMSYEDASVEIDLLMERVNEINNKLTDVTADLNMSLYR